MAAFFISMMAVATQSAQGSVSSRSAPNEVEASRDFWTPQRMKDAAKREPLVGGGFVRKKEASSPVHQRNIPVYAQQPAIGRLFFRYGPYIGSCSASVIYTPSRRIVLTAGHCLKLEGVWSRSLMFAPAYKNGRAPFGKFYGKSWWVSRTWANYSNPISMNFDYGAVVTSRNWNGVPIGDITGMYGYQTFSQRVGRTHVVGYPAGRANGQTLRQCYSDTWAGDRYSYLFPGPVGMFAKCNMAKGSSGGPWLSEYESDDGESTELYVDGVTSRGTGRTMTSSYFGTQFRDLIWNAENR